MAKKRVAKRKKRAKDPTKLGLVLVTWTDHAAHSHGWKASNDAALLTGLECQTAGFLVGADKYAVRVSLNSDQQGYVGETMVILREQVKRIKKLK